MKSRQEMMEMVLAAPGLQRTIARLAGVGDGDEQTCRERARKCFLEIASDYSERWLGIWERILSRLWRNIYDDFIIDQGGIANIREITRRMPCVILPCHRSHVDYLILSYIFYQHQIPLPHVAAGDNMNFWPLGYIFRQSGAFFLRRRFHGDDLYADVFATYVETLLREGVPIEFFLEGGRSRTGKMVMPKYGMISMILRAYQDNVSDDIALLPVYLGYDRIIEEHSYLAELSGAAKKSESVLDVIKHTRVMMHRYGRVYVNFGTPISLKSYYAAQTNNFAELTAAEQQATYRDVGYRVVAEINRVATATPIAIVASALLCHGGRETKCSVLAETFSDFHDYLKYRRVNMAPSLAMKDNALAAAIQTFIEWACLVRKENPDERNGAADSYLLPDDKRLRMEYYKNNIIHHFISLSFLATAILACPEAVISFRLVRDDYIFLKRIFSLEFMMGDDHGGELEESLAYLRCCGMLQMDEGKDDWELGEGARERLSIFSGLVGSYLESYRVVIKVCSQLHNELEKEKDQLSYMREWAEKMYARGEIVRAESMSGVTYANALKFLRVEAIISPASSRAEEQAEGIGAVIDKEGLATLQSHLARFS